MTSARTLLFRARTAGVDPRHLETLLLLLARGPIRQADVRHELELAKNTWSRDVAVLTLLGWINRRGRFLEITSKGRGILRDLFDIESPRVGTK